MSFLSYIFFWFMLLWNVYSYAESNLHDPTHPAIADVVPDQKQAAEEAYVLRAIFISTPKQRIALINDVYVREGEQLGLDVVETVNKNFVVLSRPGKKR